MKLGIPTFGRSKTQIAEASPAPPATTEAAPAKPAKPAPPRFKGEQIQVAGPDGKPISYGAWVSSSSWFWWKVEGPSPGHIEAGIRAKWGEDGVWAITGQGYLQSMHTGVYFCYVSKSGILKAPKERAAQEARDRKAEDRAQAAKRKADARREAAQAAKTAKLAPTPPAAATEPATSEAGSAT